MVVIPPPGLYQQPTTTVVAAGRPAGEQPTYSRRFRRTRRRPSRRPGPAAGYTGCRASLPLPVPEPTPAPTSPPGALPIATATPLPTPHGRSDGSHRRRDSHAGCAGRRPHVDGKYGHAADYTWLQGELDRHYRGHLELRYRSVSEDDPYGGKVRLEDDPRLAEFRPGDIIAVEGELLTDPDGPSAAPWAQYRRYHIRSVRLVERK